MNRVGDCRCGAVHQINRYADKAVSVERRGVVGEGVYSRIRKGESWNEIG